MTAEPLSAARPSLSPRASVALLTLQLRSVLQDAAAAEADADAMSGDAVAEMLVRLQPFVEQRRRTLDDALARERAAAAALISAARREAEVIVAMSSTPREGIAARVAAIVGVELASGPVLAPEPLIELVPAEPLVVEPPVEAIIVEPLAVEPAVAVGRDVLARLDLQLRALMSEVKSAEAEAAAVEVEFERLVSEHRAARVEAERVARANCGAQLTAARHAAARRIATAHQEAAALLAPMDDRLPEPLVPSWSTDLVPAPAAPALAQSGTSAVQPANSFMLDADAFARIVATVLAAVLDDRLSRFNGGAAQQPTIVISAPVAEPQSFWRHARHLDVLLLAFAAVIVLVLLAAWMA